MYEKAKPILFSTDMVRAILDGRKTQTRRVIREMPDMTIVDDIWNKGRFLKLLDVSDANFKEITGEHFAFGYRLKNDSAFYNLYVPLCRREGDILWVRETWVHLGSDSFDDMPPGYWYKANLKGHEAILGAKWKPSIHMPREAARIFLRVKRVWPERVQDISEKDAKAEGMRSYWLTKEAGKNADDWHESSDPPFIGAAKEIGVDLCSTRREAFQQLWDSLNAKRDGGKYAWDKNPWVWCYEFERLEEPDNAK